MAYGFQQPMIARYAQGGGIASALAQGPMAPAVNTVQAAGRGVDTQLAHISPDEAAFIDHLQGGRKVNPMTGLPEYSMFGNILKAVARAGAAIGGFMIAGPAGAAAGAGAATKLTGGSWKESLTAAALSGVGGELGNGIGGGGWNPTSAGSTLGTAAGNATSGLGMVANVAKSAGGLGSTLGALSQPLEHTAAPPPMPSAGGSSIHINDVEPQPRTFQPYEGDPTKYATPGSGGAGHVFYNPLDPIPKYRTPDDQLPLTMAGGGMVMGLQGPDLGARGLRGGGMDMPGQPGGGISGPAAPGLGAHTQQLRQAALLGYQMARTGGAVHGAGTGESDSVPAMLSVGEHIVDQDTVDLLGGGSNARGHKVLERMKQDARSGHVPDPKKPPAFQGAARAKKRAGMK